MDINNQYGNIDGVSLGRIFKLFTSFLVGRQAISFFMAKVNGMRDLKVDVVLGAQWGDEGKGKIVDLLAESADLCCRCQVSYNLRLLGLKAGKVVDIRLGISLVVSRC